MLNQGEKPSFIDHLVLIVKDIKKTIDFYNAFLGKPENLEKDSVSYKIGDTKIFFGLPYKEYDNPDKDMGGINHIALGIRTIDELRFFESILNNASIKNSGIQVDKYGQKEFIWFDDPDGYRLEFYLRPNEDDKNFGGWFKVKNRLEKSIDEPPLFKEREIWWCMIGENVGVEISGKGRNFTRPILVFKKLSKAGFLGIPMSTRLKDGTWYVKIKQGGKKAIIVLSQTRVFSSKRLYQKIGELDNTDFALVVKSFSELFVKFVPPKGGVVGKSQI